MIKSIHDFSVTDIYGKNFDFNKMKGKKIMVVNTASKCGFTPQYKGLQELYEKYKDRGLVIIGVPSADFANQEFGQISQVKHQLDSRLEIGSGYEMAVNEYTTGNNKEGFHFSWLHIKNIRDRDESSNF